MYMYMYMYIYTYTYAYTCFYLHPIIVCIYTYMAIV